MFDEKIKKIFENLGNINEPFVDEIGIVISFSDGMCLVRGLQSAFYGEEIIFDCGNSGIILEISDEHCSIFVFNKNPIKTGEVCRRTKQLFLVPLTEKFLGRVIDFKGRTIDVFEKISDKDIYEYKGIESIIPGIAERKSVNQPLSTGILVIDSLIPIGKGQRQLFLGNRGTGKTVSIIDLIINQKNNNVVCIYVAIAQQESNIAQIREILDINDCLDNTIILTANSGSLAIHHYLAPYVGQTIAEYFCHKLKRDVCIVFDDLTNHAIAYREMSLLMRKPPAREAFPGDVFYIHSRLLERAGNFINSASITAIPVAQLQENDISAYIPTNLISITDGQIFFDSKLFNYGIRPAINIELSVSRVGGAAQKELLNKLSKMLKLYIAQYHELSIFAQFGSDLDDESVEKLKRGKVLIELLSQEKGCILSLADEIIILYLFKNFYKSLISLENKKFFISWIIDFMKATNEDLYEKLNTGENSPEGTILDKLHEFIIYALGIFEKN